jgi:hypothetical protein
MQEHLAVYAVTNMYSFWDSQSDYSRVYALGWGTYATWDHRTANLFASHQAKELSAVRTNLLCLRWYACLKHSATGRFGRAQTVISSFQIFHGFYGFQNAQPL